MSEEIKMVETPIETPKVEIPVIVAKETQVVKAVKVAKSKKAKAPREKKAVKEGTRDGHKTYPTYVAGKSCGAGKHEYRKVADKKYARCVKCSSTRTVKAEKKA